jgi:ribonucleoside-diphosphate reductase alpha chain
MAVAGWEGPVAGEGKGPAPIMDEEFEVTAEMLRKRPEMARDGWKVGDKIPARCCTRVQPLHAARGRGGPGAGGRTGRGRCALHPPQLDRADRHHLAVAGQQRQQRHRAELRPPLQPQRDPRRQEDQGKGRRLQLRAAGLPRAGQPEGHAVREDGARKLPDYFITADDITPKAHVDIQAAAQKWVDSSISKTANVPTDYPYEDFKDIYRYAYEQGPEGLHHLPLQPGRLPGRAGEGADLENTTYRFELEDGSVVEVKGNEQIEYDGELHTAANLFDAP